MNADVLFVATLFIGSILVVMISIECGYRFGRRARRRSEFEKEAEVSLVANTVLALFAFILAFTFGIAANRFDARSQLVREEANKIRIAWARADFLPKSDRAESKALILTYLSTRIAAAKPASPEGMQSVLSKGEAIQSRLWDIAVSNAHGDMNSQIGSLYVESLNEMSAINAMRVAVALRMKIPTGVWLILMGIAMLGMLILGYLFGLSGSTRTIVTPLMAVAFGLVIGIIGLLDRPAIGLVAVSQQPLIDLRSLLDVDAAKPNGRNP